jgi:ATP-dependent helicase/nuclease subunit A
LFEANYTPVCYPENKVQEAAAQLPAEFHVCVLDASDDDEATPDDQLDKDETEAAFVAGKIYELVNSGHITYGDIAILLRSWSTLHDFEKHLRNLNIPYSSDRIGNLFADAPANDLMRLLRLVVYPADTDAYAAVLRSPLVGLSYASLTVCLSAQKEQENAPIPFGDNVPLAETELERYERGQRLYRRICEKSRRLSACELLSEVWYMEGYRYETLWNAAVTPYREIYDYLFEIARRADADGGGLTGFVDALARLQNDDERLDDVEIPLERTEAVRILSVHKSKGLEFPVVFLCGAGRHSQYDSSGLVYVTGENSPHGKRVGIKPPMPEELLSEKHKKEIKSSYFFEAGTEESRAERRAELRRLLYVAMTRAEKMLYITGCFSLGATDAEDSLPLSLKHAVQEQLEKQAKKIDSGEKSPCPENDIILDNDTFFGMFLPAYTAQIADDGTPPTDFFPTLEAIPRLTRADIQPSTRHFSLSEVLAHAAPHYQTANVIQTPTVLSNRTTPTALAWELDSAARMPRQTNLAVFSENCERMDAPDLDYAPLAAADFGTLAHACVEALFANHDPMIPSKIAALLTPLQYEALLATGMEMARQFADSPLGVTAQNAAWRKSEYAFRSRIERADGTGLFIDGTIDLLFEDGDTVNVVDFKTDAVENPAEHLAQMACYYHAAKVMRRKPCRVWLYYLRTGNAVEVTEDVAQYAKQKR